MASESNKDEAHKCIAIAQGAIAAGKIQKAKKYLLKAQALYPTEIADNLLASISDAAPSTSGATGIPSAGTAGVRRRKVSSPITYGPKQEKAVRDVVLCNDYYELFGVSREASAADVEKAYKKLALRLHPDKNHAPGAAEAFKKVKTAKDVLTNPELRWEYDTRVFQETSVIYK